MSAIVREWAQISFQVPSLVLSKQLTIQQWLTCNVWASLISIQGSIQVLRQGGADSYLPQAACRCARPSRSAMLPSGGTLQHTNHFVLFEGFVSYAGLNFTEASLVLDLPDL